MGLEPTQQRPKPLPGLGPHRFGTTVIYRDSNGVGTFGQDSLPSVTGDVSGGFGRPPPHYFGERVNATFFLFRQGVECGVTIGT